MAINIIHCDNHLVVVFKEPGTVVQGAPARERSLCDDVKAWLRERFDKPGNVYLGVVHRLDRPVAGVVLFARTSKAARRVSRQFRLRTVRKTYLAVVEGSPAAERGTLRHWMIVRDGRPSIVSRPCAEAKEAELLYERLESSATRSLLRLHPITGRKHQLRLQLAHSGIPICGDQHYGAAAPLVARPEAIALMSEMLSIEHPTTKERLDFRVEPPPWWPWPA